jgi:hypothetical protein
MNTKIAFTLTVGGFATGLTIGGITPIILLGGGLSFTIAEIINILEK